MIIIKQITICILMTLYGLTAVGQGLLKIDKELDFLITADNNTVSISIPIINIGNKPVFITSVNSSMPSLHLEFDPKPILPNGQAAINVKFTPTTYPEGFFSDITIKSSAQNDNVKTRIRVKILNNEEKPQILYTINYDGVKFRTKDVDFGNVYYGQTKTDTIYFYNTLKTGARVTAQFRPPYIKAKSQPQIVTSGEKGMLIITCDGTLAEERMIGHHSDSFIILVNGQNTDGNNITTNVNFRENFSGLTESQLHEAPRCKLSTHKIELGQIKEGSKTKHTVTISNIGKSPLTIRRISSGCGCTVVTTSDELIQAGKSSSLKVTFDSTERSGLQIKTITIITNDPINPEQTITLFATVD